MPWIECKERMPREGRVVMAAFGGGSTMPMRCEGGRWVYPAFGHPTTLRVMAWREDEEDVNKKPAFHWNGEQEYR